MILDNPELELPNPRLQALKIAGIQGRSRARVSNPGTVHVGCKGLILPHNYSHRPKHHPWTTHSETTDR